MQHPHFVHDQVECGRDPRLVRRGLINRLQRQHEQQTETVQQRLLLIGRGRRVEHETRAQTGLHRRAHPQRAHAVATQRTIECHCRWCTIATLCSTQTNHGHQSPQLRSQRLAGRRRGEKNGRGREKIRHVHVVDGQLGGGRRIQREQKILEWIGCGNMMLLTAKQASNITRRSSLATSTHSSVAACAQRVSVIRKLTRICWIMYGIMTEILRIITPWNDRANNEDEMDTFIAAN